MKIRVLTISPPYKNSSPNFNRIGNNKAWLSKKIRVCVPHYCLCLSRTVFYCVVAPQNFHHRNFFIHQILTKFPLLEVGECAKDHIYTSIISSLVSSTSGTHSLVPKRKVSSLSRTKPRD